MASEVDICNLGSSHILGEAEISSINPSDGSREANLCAVFYPIARDNVLQMHNWDIATRRVALALLSTSTDDDSTVPEGWIYKFKGPSNHLRSLKVYQNDSNAFPLDFTSEGDDDEGLIIMANVEDAFLKYTKRITTATLFPPLMVSAITWLLASYLAGPLGKGVDARNGALREFGLIMSLASSSDANNRKEGGNTESPENYNPQRSRL